MGWFGEWLAGVDTSKQESELERMKLALQTAKAAEATGVAPEIAAAQSGFGTGQGVGFGTTGDTQSGMLKDAVNFFTNWGAELGSAIGLEGVGTADPGSVADTVGKGIGDFRRLTTVVLILAAVGAGIYFMTKGKS